MAATYLPHNVGQRRYLAGHRWTERLVWVWLAVILYWPVMTFGAIQSRGDYAFLVIMLGWLLGQGRIRRRALHAAAFFLLVVVFFLAVTFRGLGLSYPFVPIQLIGFLKPLIVLVIWVQVLQTISVEKLFRWISILLIPASILALLQIVETGWVSGLTLSLYSSLAQSPTRFLFGASGPATRAVSVFESPVYAGLVFLLGIVMSWSAVRTARGVPEKALHKFALCLAVAAGLATASSTFLAGFLIVAILVLGRSFVHLRLKNVWNMALVLALIVVGVGYYASYHGSANFISQLLYQVHGLAGGMFTQRFGSSGSTTEALKGVSRYLVTGIGATSPGYFVGDDVYLVLLVRVGLVGLLAYLGLFALAFYRTLFSKAESSFFIGLGLVLILAAGAGSPDFWIPRGSELVWMFVAAALCMAPQKSLSGRQRVDWSSVPARHRLHG